MLMTDPCPLHCIMAERSIPYSGRAPRAQVTAPELEQFIVNGVIGTGNELGSGAYGSVEEVVIPGARVAAKKLHPGLVNFGSERQVRKWISDFVDECKLMTLLRHPNIVQFLGVCYLPDSHLPVLLMEKLQISLDNLLETNENIPNNIKLSLLIGTARGVVYLHSRTPTIVHRDLTARNVLVDSGLEAKIADLGVARMVTLQPGQVAATMTTAPGNVLYMPPEAVGDQSTRYNTAIDIFSFGVVSLFTLTQTFPKDIKAPNYLDSTTQMLIARSEIERREEYIQMMSSALGDTHPLVQLTLSCLQYNPQHRPSAVEVLQRLKEAKEIIPQNYTETKLELIRRIANNEDDIQLLRTEYERQRIEDKAQIDHFQALVSRKQAEIDSLQAEKLQQVGALEDLTSQQQRQLEVQCAEIEQLSDCLKSLELQGVRAKPLEERVDRPVARPRKMGKPQPPRKITFKWLRCMDIPLGMETWSLPVVHNEKLYVMGMHGGPQIVLEYTPGRDLWDELPPPPVYDFTIATLEGKLVVVGGYDKTTNIVTKTILTFDQQQWLKLFPDIPTARSIPAVTKHQDHLIVAGGLDSRGTRTSNVDILDATNKKWLSAESLPHTDAYKSVLCDDMMYLVCQNTKFVLQAHVPSLISQAKSGASSHRIWESLSNAPFYRSSPIIIRNTLLTLGGSTTRIYPDYQPTASIQLYDPIASQWSIIGELPQPMTECVCVVLSGELFVLGGSTTCFFRPVYSANIRIDLL